MKNDGTKHNSDKELFGQGLANIIVPFFGGVPATAALARTAVNVKAGAKSRLAAMIHAVVLLLIILLMANLVSTIPLAALAGVLIATTAHMIQPKELLRTAKTSKLDALVLWTTFTLTVALDLVSAVVVGLALALALRKTRLSTRYPRIDEDETLGD
jgi:SulP family sulfate permease